MLFKCCALLGSLFLLFSFLLHLFPMIGQLSNRQFLRHMYFQRAINRSENTSYQNGLWNYCSGTLNSVDFCSSNHQSYNWGNTPVIGEMVPQEYQPNTGHFRHLFTGLFALTMAGVCLSFVLWIMSLPVMLCCGRKSRRAPSAIMSFLTFTNFMVTMVAFILALILSISTNKGLSAGWEGHAGNSVWTLLGAMGALLVGFLCFNGACCGGGSRVTDPEHGSRKPNMFNKPPPPGTSSQGYGMQQGGYQQGGYNQGGMQQGGLGAQQGGYQQGGLGTQQGGYQQGGLGAQQGVMQQGGLGTQHTGQGIQQTGQGMQQPASPIVARPFQVPN